MPDRINLDANANAPATPAVKEAVMRALNEAANPSSAHAAGDVARSILTSARDAVTSLCAGVFPEDVVFTSGCTEANNMVVASAGACGATLITTAVEHPSILRAADALQINGGRVVILPVDANGRVRLECLQASIEAECGPFFVSIQTANSETGVIQPIEQIAALVARHSNGLLHTDAAQAFGKLALEVGQGRGADVLSVSGHKIHAPMGVGALLLREGEDRLRPLLLGGDQEGGLRAGTQPVTLIAGFGEACSARSADMEADGRQMRGLRDQLEGAVRHALPSVKINGEAAPRLPNTSNLQFPGLDAMSLIALLDAEGVLCSQGSACHSRRPEPSPVLMAMGLTEEQAFASVRFSVSPLNTEAEIKAAVAVLVNVCQRLGLR